MKLHENNELFQNYIALASQEEEIDEAIVLKDYFVILALKKLYEFNDELVFIGGTSLSKCFGIINRFSEDIDLVSTANSRKGKQRQTHEVIQELVRSWNGIVEENNNQSSDFKEMYLHYPSSHKTDLDQRVKVELITFMVPFPIICRKITSIINKYLDESEIEEHDMVPIMVKTQEPYRTMMEKIILEKELYKEYLDGKISDESQAKRARDFYDIHKIWEYYNKTVPFSIDELNYMVKSRVENRRGRTTILMDQLSKYLLSDMFVKRNIAKQLNDIDQRKLSIRDLDTQQIIKSLKELDDIFRKMILE